MGPYEWYVVYQTMTPNPDFKHEPLFTLTYLTWISQKRYKIN